MVGVELDQRAVGRPVGQRWQRAWPPPTHRTVRTRLRPWPSTTEAGRSRHVHGTVRTPPGTAAMRFGVCHGLRRRGPAATPTAHRPRRGGARRSHRRDEPGPPSRPRRRAASTPVTCPAITYLADGYRRSQRGRYVARCRDCTTCREGAGATHDEVPNQPPDTVLPSDPSAGARLHRGDAVSSLSRFLDIHYADPSARLDAGCATGKPGTAEVRRRISSAVGCQQLP